MQQKMKICRRGKGNEAGVKLKRSKMRKPEVIILYNNKEITRDIKKYLMSLTYSDATENQSDELEIELKDNHKLFQNEWRPQKGDKISAQIGYKDETMLDCGIFTVDEPEFNMDDTGDTFKIKALAASVNEGIRQINSESFRNKTLTQIANKIGAKHGYKVAGNYGKIKIPYCAQVKESDIAFLKRISQEYGYIFKLTDKIITFIPAGNLNDAKPVNTFVKKDVTSLLLRDCSTKTYTSCSVKYLNNKGILQTYTAKNNQKGLLNECLKLDIKCSNKTQARAIAEANLKKGAAAVEGSISFKRGQQNVIAGANIMLNLDNSFTGKYKIKKSTHTITSEDYTTSAEIEAVWN